MPPSPAPPPASTSALTSRAIQPHPSSNPILDGDDHHLIGALTDWPEILAPPGPPPASAFQNDTATRQRAQASSPVQARREKPRKRKVQWLDEDQIIDLPAERVAARIGGTLERGGGSSSLLAPNEDGDAGRSQRLVSDGDGSAGQPGSLVDTGRPEEALDDPQADLSATATKKGAKDYLESEIYNAIAYGDMRSYMKYKRAKLKVQEAALIQEEEELIRAGEAAERESAQRPSRSSNDRTASAGVTKAGDGEQPQQRMDGQKSDIFRGCCVYINGQTHPPYSELRRLLVLHGGQHMAYLDQKTPCTHIVASNLTPKKRIEFKDYKVVLPGWILESIEIGRRADWRKWKCDAITGSNGHVGGNLLGNQQMGMQGWRDVARQAQIGKSLPRFGEAVESPWGRPSNQKTLLQGFVKPRDTATNSSLAKQEARNDVPVLHAAQTDGDSGSSSRSSVDHKERASRDASFLDLEQRNQRPLAPPIAAHDMVPNGTTPPGSKEPRDPRRTEPESRDAVRASPVKTAPAEVKGQDELQLGDVPTTAPQTPSKSKDKVDYSIGTDPRTKAAATAASDLTVKSGYASLPSNTHAARLLASPSWRERNTATSEGFLAGYFAKSRLHHLSTWKTSLQDMVSSALREAGRQPGSIDLPKAVERVIMHIDFDSFFVSVGLRKRPDLKDQPVVVCHGSGTGPLPAAQAAEKRSAENQSTSTSEIASCNYVARKFGVRNGMSLGQARKLCAQVQTIPYDFKAYNDISLTFYAFLLEHADALQAVSVDEALIDVSMLLENMRNQLYPAGALYQRYRDRLGSQDGERWSEEKQLAEAFRDEIRDLCACEVSIGIGSNILLARLATRKAKPGGSFHLTEDLRQSFLDGLDVDDLHGIGWSLRNRLRDMFKTINVGEIRRTTTERKLVHELGPKKGKVVWEKMHGKDADRLEGNKLRQSVGSHVNYGIRFLTNQEAEAFVDGMCQEVSQRARAVRLRGRQVSVQVMVRAKDAPQEASKFLGHGICDTHHRSTQVSGPGGCAIDDKERIQQAAWPLIRDLKADPKELRGIAISLNKLELSDGTGKVASPKPQAGQSVLSFGTSLNRKKADQQQVDRVSSNGSTTTLPYAGLLATSVAEHADSADDDVDEDAGANLPTLEPGRFAATPRRPGCTKDLTRSAGHGAEAGKPSKSPTLPPSTQFAIPSASQLDPTVVSALPTPLRQQILAATGMETSRGSRNRSPCATPIAAPRATPNTPRVLPRSTPTTPQKAKVAPSPAMAEALLLPSASQIDPAVLAELPESIRRDILRQARSHAGLGTSAAMEASASASSSTTSSPSTSTPTKRKRKLADSTLPFLPLHLPTHHFEAGDRKGEDLGDRGERLRKAALFRSLSESPRKRTKHREGAAVAAGPVIGGAPLVTADLSSITRQDLVALSIDADVFYALPPDMQLEMYTHLAARRASERTRFKAGHNRGSWEELTRAERGRRATRRAAELEGEAQDFVARPQSRTVDDRTRLLPDPDRTGTAERGDPPSLRGATTVDALLPLLSSWFTAFEPHGPREGDVNRIATFFETCLDPTVPVGSRRWNVEMVRTCLVSLRGTVVRRFGTDGETTRRARVEVQRLGKGRGEGEREGEGEDASSEGKAQTAGERWWVAFYTILQRVNQRVAQRCNGAVLLRE